MISEIHLEKWTVSFVGGFIDIWQLCLCPVRLGYLAAQYAADEQRSSQIAFPQKASRFSVRLNRKQKECGWGDFKAHRQASNIQTPQHHLLLHMCIFFRVQGYQCTSHSMQYSRGWLQKVRVKLEMNRVISVGVRLKCSTHQYSFTCTHLNQQH